MPLETRQFVRATPDRINDPAEPDHAFIVDDDEGDPTIVLPRKRLAAIMRRIADALGYADRKTLGFWLDTRDPMTGGVFRFYGLPDLVLMVDKAKGSRPIEELAPSATVGELRDALANIAIIAELAADPDALDDAQRERFLRLVLADVAVAVRQAVTLIDQAAAATLRADRSVKQ